jgi:hypothetical protein
VRQRWNIVRTSASLMEYAAFCENCHAQRSWAIELGAALAVRCDVGGNRWDRALKLRGLWEYGVGAYSVQY